MNYDPRPELESGDSFVLLDESQQGSSSSGVLHNLSLEQSYRMTQGSPQSVNNQSNQESRHEFISRYESDPELEQALLEYPGIPHEVQHHNTANSPVHTISLAADQAGWSSDSNKVALADVDGLNQANDMPRSQRSHQKSMDNPGSYETISGYERVQYNPMLEQVLLEISQKRTSDSASSASADEGQGSSETNEHVNYDSWMEQALLEYQGRTVTLQEHAPAQNDSHRGGNGMNKGYERVIYDPRLEQALSDYQRRAEEGKSDPLLLRQLLDQLGQRTSQASGYGTISGYERVQYDPRLEQMLMEISRRRLQDRSTASDESRTNQEYERVIYDPRLEQALLEYQRSGNPVQLRQLLGQGTNQGYERVLYDSRLEQVLLEISRRRGRRRSLDGRDELETGEATFDCEHISYDSWMEQAYLECQVTAHGHQNGDLAPQPAESVAPGQRPTVQMNQGYERVTYDPRLIRAIQQMVGSSKQKI